MNLLSSFQLMQTYNPCRTCSAQWAHHHTSSTFFFQISTLESNVRMKDLEISGFRDDQVNPQRYKHTINHSTIYLSVWHFSASFFHPSSIFLNPVVLFICVIFEICLPPVFPSTVMKARPSSHSIHSSVSIEWHQQSSTRHERHWLHHPRHTAHHDNRL